MNPTCGPMSGGYADIISFSFSLNIFIFTEISSDISLLSQFTVVVDG